MISHFVTRLEVEAGKAGGSLCVKDIRAIAERFLGHEQPRFAPVFQRSWDECGRARDTLQYEAARRHPFDRILMRRFAHLFPPRQGDDGGIGVLSLRLIPGFNLAVDKMIGPTLYEQCQHKCQGILDRHRLGTGGFDWELIYADADANALANDVLVLITHHFADFGHRRAWFLDLANSHLSSVPGKGEDARWKLTEHGFAELMHALFADLRAAMLARPEDVRRRYGDHTFEALRMFFRRLEGG